MSISTFAHRLVVGAAGRPPLVLLHGSDGHETDLMPTGQALAPGASLLGVRGAVAMESGYGFFRRLADRKIDEADLEARVPPLAGFIRSACIKYGLGESRPIAVGYSNGAIMAAALLMRDPDLLSAAILLRPLSPFAAEPTAQLEGVPVFIIDGAHDERRSPGDGRRLADRLGLAGADVKHHLLPTGHAITAEDQQLAHHWLQALQIN